MVCELVGRPRRMDSVHDPDDVPLSVHAAE